MPRPRSNKSLIEEIAQPFEDLPPLAGILAAILLGILGWLAPLFGGVSAIATVSLQFGRWFAWLVGFLVLGYTVAGVVRRAIDSRRFDTTDDPARLTWSQFERSIAEFYRRKARQFPLAEVRLQTAG